MSDLGFIRYYLIINEHVADQFGGRYFTFKTNRENQPDLRFNGGVIRMIGYSDKVIICDDDRAWYAKNREENHTTAKVDLDELAWIKLSSTDLDLTHV